jgi:hypothetical protein
MMKKEAASSSEKLPGNQQKRIIFFFSRTFRQTLGSTQVPVSWESEGLSSG